MRAANNGASVVVGIFVVGGDVGMRSTECFQFIMLKICQWQAPCGLWGCKNRAHSVS